MKEKINIIVIFNTAIQFIIFILYLIRFIKFIKIKQFLFNNKDIYDDENYFPNKVFNFDSFSLALSINFFIFIFIDKLFFYFPCCECECDCCFFSDKRGSDNDDSIIILIYLFIPFILTFIILTITDLVNDSKIIKIYNNLAYNWKTNPLKSINLMIKKFIHYQL